METVSARTRGAQRRQRRAREDSWWMSVRARLAVPFSENATALSSSVVRRRPPLPVFSTAFVTSLIAAAPLEAICTKISILPPDAVLSQSLLRRQSTSSP
eukprot:5251850-Pleurochrysis_carterae.AAC.3